MKSTLFYVYSSLVILLLCEAVGLALFLHNIPRMVEDNQTKTDAIVVLTGGKGRLLTGISLLEEGKAKQLLISGVGENANINELKALSGEVLPYQVRPLEDRITLGHFAKNTKGNAIEAAIWMELYQYRSLRLVTSNYHIPRSMLEFKDCMPKDVVIIPHPVSSEQIKLSQWWLFPGTAKLILSEYHKYIAVWFISQVKYWFNLKSEAV